MYACSITNRRGRFSTACSTQNAAPMAVPSSPAAGWTKTSLNGVRSKIFPFATELSAQPPARQSRGSLVLSQRSFSTWKKISS